MNPHGQVIPPAGSAEACTGAGIRLPTTNASNAGFNPDGFFAVGTRDENGVCLLGNLDVTLFSCTGITAVNGELVCGTEQQIGTSTFPNGTLIKFTEANGVGTPTVTPMGSNNGSKNPNGGAVAFHIKASGDLEVCSADGCEICLVPPPPK